VGDPVASLFGIRYGDLSVRFYNGKSLIGTLAGILACGGVTWFFCQSYTSSMSQALVLTCVAGLSGGLAEMLPMEIDDNFTIPVVAGFFIWLIWMVMGFPL
jgi:dolichol kinase